MRPPRALWVPFALGRPFGAPNAPDFQRDVVLAALSLLTHEEGGVLVDYEVEAPVADVPAEGWACPLNLPPMGLADDDEGLRADLQREFGQMRTWYEMAIKARGHTTVGASGLTIDDLAGLFDDLLRGQVPQTGVTADEPVDGLGVPLPRLANLAADDVRAMYAEALTAQPGQDQLSANQLADWFYRETAAGRAFYAVKRLGAASADTPFGEIAGGLRFPARLAP